VTTYPIPQVPAGFLILFSLIGILFCKDAVNW